MLYLLYLFLNPNNPVVILRSRWSLSIVPIGGAVLFELHLSMLFGLDFEKCFDSVVCFSFHAPFSQNSYFLYFKCMSCIRHMIPYCVVFYFCFLFVFALCYVYPALQAYKDCPFLIASSIFSNIYVLTN